MKLKAFRVQGVQAHEDSVVALGQVTSIIGDTNAGKTALIRGLRGLVENAPTKSLLRDGYENLVVEVWGERDGKTFHVGWVKGGKKNDYHLVMDLDAGGAVELKQVGAQAPEAVEAVLGLSGVLDGKGQRYYPNFRTQYDPPSMVFESESDRLSRLTKMSGVGTLQAAMRILQRDLKRVRADVKQQEVAVLTAEERLQEYVDVEACLVSAGEADGVLGALEQRERVLGRLRRVREFREEMGAYDGLAQVSHTVGVSRSLVRRLQSAYKARWCRDELRTRYRGLGAVGEALSALQGRCSRLEQVWRAALLRDRVPGDVKWATEVLNRVRDRLEGVERAREAVSERAQLSKLEQSLVQLRDKLEVLTAERDGYRGSIETCPVCGRSG